MWQRFLSLTKYRCVNLRQLPHYLCVVCFHLAPLYCATCHFKSLSCQCAELSCLIGRLCWCFPVDFAQTSPVIYGCFDGVRSNLCALFMREYLQFLDLVRVTYLPRVNIDWHQPLFTCFYIKWKGTLPRLISIPYVLCMYKIVLY